ncbi:MAG: MarR family transcriptional regulator [Chloroflexota bacterium]
MSSPKPIPDLPDLASLGDSAHTLMPLVGFLLNKTALKVSQQTDASLAPFGIQVRHYGILLFLARINTTVSQREIGERLWIDRNTMVSLIDHLESQELAIRTRDPNDRRSYAISITEKGRTLVEQAGKVVTKTDAQFVETLNASELEQLTQLLVKLLKGTQEA